MEVCGPFDAIMSVHSPNGSLASRTKVSPMRPGSAGALQISSVWLVVVGSMVHLHSSVSNSFVHGLRRDSFCLAIRVIKVSTLANQVAFYLPA